MGELGVFVDDFLLLCVIWVIFRWFCFILFILEFDLEFGIIFVREVV